MEKNTKLSCLVRVDQAEAIRRGFTTEEIVTVELDLNQLTPEEREHVTSVWINGELRKFSIHGEHPNRRVGYSLLSSEKFRLLLVSDPAEESVIQAIQNQMVESREKLALDFALHEQEEKAYVKAVEAAEQLVRTDPMAGVSRKGYSADYIHPKGHPAVDVDDISQEARDIIAKNQADFDEAERKKLEDKRAKLEAEKKSEFDKVLPYLDAVEKDMYDRGYLNPKDVQKRIDADVVAGLVEILGEGLYDVHVGLRKPANKPRSREAFLFLREVETVTESQFELIYEDEVQTIVETVDGREIAVHVELIPEEDDEDSDD